MHNIYTYIYICVIKSLRGCTAISAWLLKSSLHLQSFWMGPALQEQLMKTHSSGVAASILWIFCIVAVQVQVLSVSLYISLCLSLSLSLYIYIYILFLFVVLKWAYSFLLIIET